MGFAGQIFAARVAVGLAVPSPGALSQTGKTLADGVSGIYGRLNKQRGEAAKTREQAAKAEMQKAEGQLDKFRNTERAKLLANSGKLARKVQGSAEQIGEAMRASTAGVAGTLEGLQSKLEPKVAKKLMSRVAEMKDPTEKGIQLAKNYAKLKDSERLKIKETMEENIKAAEAEIKGTQRKIKVKTDEIKKTEEEAKLFKKEFTGDRRTKPYKKQMKAFRDLTARRKEEIDVMKKGAETQLVTLQRRKEQKEMLKQIARPHKMANAALKEEEQRLKDAAKTAETKYHKAQKKTKEVLRQSANAAAQFGQKIASNAQSLATNFTTSLRDTIAVMTAFYYKLSQNTQELIAFERELMNANSVFNVTKKELFETSNQIVQFGQQFGIEMQNGATGLYQLASAGLSADESMQMLPHTLKLSAAVQGDHNTIAKLTTQTIAGFGFEAEQAAEVTDKFAHAIQKSLIEYEDLSSAVKFALPFFTSTGQSLDQLLGALQVLTNRALEAGIAGRGLRQALSEFAESAMDAESGFRQMGVEILNAEGNMKPLTEIAAQFKAQVGESVNNTELLTTLIEGLNVRGATAFIHLVQASDEFTEAVENSKNAGGELDEMVRIQTESMAAQIQILKNNVQMMFFHADGVERANGAMNEFHSAILEGIQALQNLFVTIEGDNYVLTTFGQEIQDIATRGVGIFVELLKQAVDVVKGFTQEGMVSTDMLKLFTLPMRITLEILQRLGPNFIKMILYYKILNSILPISIVLNKAFNAQLSMTAILATGGLVLLVGAMYAVNKEFGILTSISTDLGLEFGALAGMAKHLFEDVLYPNILHIGLEMFAFGAVSVMAIKMITNAVGGREGLVSGFKAILPVLKFIVQVYVGIFIAKIRTVINLVETVVDIFGEIHALLTGQQGLMETIVNIAGHIYDMFVQQFTIIDDMIMSVDALAGPWQAIKDIVTGIVDGLREAVDYAKELDIGNKVADVGYGGYSIGGAYDAGADFVGGFFANGGYVRGMKSGGMMGARRPYIVGERGPELFMPSSSGQVINNSRTDSIMRQGLDAGPATKGGAQDLVVSQLVVGNAKLKNTRMAVDSFAGVV